MNNRSVRVLNLLDDFNDAVVKSEILKEIPYFGQFLKFADMSHTISNQMFILKLSRFVEDIGEISSGEFQQIRNALEFSPQQELADKIVLAVDSLYDVSKAKYIAQALCLYSKLELTKEDFLRSLDLIQKMYIGDFEVLVSQKWISGATSDELEQHGLSALVGTPLLKIENVNQQELIKDNRNNELGVIRFSLSEFGSTFLAVLKNKKPYGEIKKADLRKNGKLKEFKES